MPVAHRQCGNPRRRGGSRGVPVPGPAGVLLARGDHVPEGRAIVLAVSAMHVLLGGVLLVTEPKLWRNSAGGAGLAAAIVIATLAS